MDIKLEKLDLIEWILKVNNISVIEKIKDIKKDFVESDDHWEILKKEELDAINRGLTDFEEGRIHSHETARKVYEKYL